LFWF